MSNKIKILFVIHDLSVGGAEKVLVNLVNHIDQDKFDVTLLALFGGGVNEQFLASHVRYKAVFPKVFPGNSKLMKLLSPKQLHQMLIKDHYDIEVAYLEGPCARIVSGCPNNKTKTVSWIHVQQKSQECASSSFRGYDEAESCYASFDSVVCVSEGVKEDFGRLFPSIKPLNVLYNVNDTDKILRLAKDPIATGVFKKGEFNIVGIGKLEKNKGFDKLLEVHAKLVEEGYPVHTRILGVGSQDGALSEQICEKGLQASFELLGYHVNPYKYLARSDLFVCASCAEGFSTATVEALVLSVPCVSTPVAGATELLGENNEFGIRTDGTDEGLYWAIRKMIIDESEYAKYKRAAKERGEKFGLSSAVAATESFLLDLAVLDKG